MKLTNLSEGVADWRRMEPVGLPGATGIARVRARQIGEMQLRLVEYSPGYLADHWCTKGHVVHVVAGSMLIEHPNGAAPCALAAGMSWYVADDEGAAHRVRSDTGATVFILD